MNASMHFYDGFDDVRIDRPKSFFILFTQESRNSYPSNRKLEIAEITKVLENADTKSRYCLC